MEQFNPWPRRRRFLAIGLLLIASSLYPVGCNRHKPEIVLLKKIFQTIQQNQWQSYVALTTTIAELNPKLPATKAQQQKFQQQDFERAVKGGPGQIDFKNSEFLGAGSELALVEVVPDYPHGKVYSLRLKVSSGGTTAEIDSRELYPQFLLIKKNQELLLLALIFPGE